MDMTLRDMSVFCTLIFPIVIMTRARGATLEISEDIEGSSNEEERDKYLVYLHYGRSDETQSHMARNGSLTR